MAHSEKYSFRNKITRLNFVMSIIIVMTHVYTDNFVNLSGYSGTIAYIQTVANDFLHGYLTWAVLGMYYALSGYLFFQNFQWKTLGQKLQSRIYTLLLPYLFWNTVMFGFFFAIGNASVSEFWEYVLLAKNSPTYFIGIIMVYTCLNPMVYGLLKNKGMAALLFVGLVAISVHGDIHIGDFSYMNFINASLPNYIYYLFGAYMGIHESDLVKKQVSAKWSAVAGVLFILLAQAYSVSSLNMLVRIAAIIAIWIAADLLNGNQKPSKMEYFAFVYFCAHIITDGIYYKLCKLVLGPSVYFPVVATMLVTIASMTSIYLGCLLVKHKIPFLYRFMSGGR